MGAFGKNGNPGRYSLYTEMKGQMVYILDTQTGAFKTYVSNLIMQQQSSDVYEFNLGDDINPDTGKIITKTQPDETLLKEMKPEPPSSGGSLLKHLQPISEQRSYTEDFDIWDYVPDGSRILTRKGNSISYKQKGGEEYKVYFEIREYKEAGEIDVSTHVLIGDPANMIIEFADSQKVDLIIMGSVGLRGINKIKTLGSVSRRVTEMASCPVLIVH